MTIGAETTYDGITSRPTYAYQPPDAFFAEGAPSGPDVYDVRDYGAVADPTVDNTPMIQAAIQAAHDAGGGIVYIPSGVYGIASNGDGGVEVLSNVFVKGDGMGETTLRLIDGSSDDITGLVRSPSGEATTNYGVADLTVDGNRANTTGEVYGIFTGATPGEPIADADVYFLRVEAQNNSGYGFDPHEQTVRMLVQDSVSHHNGFDGFVADYVSDSVYVGNIAYANDRHGFNIVTSSHDVLLDGNIAYDNASAGIAVQRGSEDRLLVDNVVVRGGEVYGNDGEGVVVRMSENVTITGVDVHDNGTYGIRVRGSSDVTIEGNTVSNNSQALNDGYSEIQITHYFDDTTGATFGSLDIAILNNVISSEGLIRARYGVEERSGDVVGTTVDSNDISGTVRGNVSLSGETSYMVVSGDDAGNSLSGSSTQDHILAGGGDDVIYARDGRDSIEAGSGDDWVSAGKGNDQVLGGDGNDYLKGDSGDDRIDGGDGDDTIYGGSGNDVLTDANGSNFISGGSGDDVIDVVSGTNTLKGDSGNDIIHGGTGVDTISGGSGNDLVFAGDGADIINGGTGNDVVFGGNGDDRIDGSSDNDTLFGEAGNDRLQGGSGNDVLDGGQGDDNLSGGSGDDRFVLSGASGQDTIDGGADHDTLDLSLLSAGAMVDLTSGTVSLNGGGGANVTSIEAVSGTQGADWLFGAHEADVLLGNGGDDFISGMAGDDILVGGLGFDTLEGGAGADIFRFTAVNGEIDVIRDFEVGLDQIDLSGQGLTFADIAVAWDAQNGTTRVSVGGHDIHLVGVAAEAVSEGDFILA
ncbi:MAG: right-handed parallel beta-helix repeat-containing protein [Hyphomicrobiaceae bacterium]|nr:right-handed parallel beta-helix repeat-containing protein [Hyphomicrobiaceae bacterium]